MKNKQFEHVLVAVMLATAASGVITTISMSFAQEGEKKVLLPPYSEMHTMPMTAPGTSLMEKMINSLTPGMKRVPMPPHDGTMNSPMENSTNSEVGRQQGTDSSAMQAKQQEEMQARQEAMQAKQEAMQAKQQEMQVQQQEKQLKQHIKQAEKMLKKVQRDEDRAATRFAAWQKKADARLAAAKNDDVRTYIQDTIDKRTAMRDAQAADAEDRIAEIQDALDDAKADLTDVQSEAAVTAE